MDFTAVQNLKSSHYINAACVNCERMWRKTLELQIGVVKTLWKVNKIIFFQHLESADMSFNKL